MANSFTEMTAMHINQCTFESNTLAGTATQAQEIVDKNNGTFISLVITETPEGKKACTVQYLSYTIALAEKY